MNKLLTVLAAVALFSLGNSSPAQAIPVYPASCTGTVVHVNGELTGPNGQESGLFRGGSVLNVTTEDLLKLTGTTISTVQLKDGVRLAIDDEHFDSHASNFETEHQFSEAGQYTAQLELFGSRYHYWGINDFDLAKEDPLAGNGPGQNRFNGINVVDSTCDSFVVNVTDDGEEPQPPEEQDGDFLHAMNRTTGQDFNGDGTEEAPFQVPLLTNTRFEVDIPSGYSLTGWSLNGFELSTQGVAFDYTLWRTGEWLLTTTLLDANGVEHTDSLYINSF